MLSSTQFLVIERRVSHYLYLFLFIFFFDLPYWCAHRRVCRESFQMPDTTIYGLDVRVTRSGREFWNLWPVVRAVYQLALPFKFPIDCSIDVAAASFAGRCISPLCFLLGRSNMWVNDGIIIHFSYISKAFKSYRNPILWYYFASERETDGRWPILWKLELHSNAAVSHKLQKVKR